MASIASKINYGIPENKDETYSAANKLASKEKQQEKLRDNLVVTVSSSDWALRETETITDQILKARITSADISYWLQQLNTSGFTASLSVSADVSEAMTSSMASVSTNPVSVEQIYCVLLQEDVIDAEGNLKDLISTENSVVTQSLFDALHQKVNGMSFMTLGVSLTAAQEDFMRKSLVSYLKTTQTNRTITQKTWEERASSDRALFTIGNDIRNESEHVVSGRPAWAIVVDENAHRKVWVGRPHEKPPVYLPKSDPRLAFLDLLYMFGNTFHHASVSGIYLYRQMDELFVTNNAGPSVIFGLEHLWDAMSSVTFFELGLGLNLNASRGSAGFFLGPVFQLFPFESTGFMLSLYGDYAPFADFSGLRLFFNAMLLQHLNVRQNVWYPWLDAPLWDFRTLQFGISQRIFSFDLRVGTTYSWTSKEPLDQVLLVSVLYYF